MRPRSLYETLGKFALGVGMGASVLAVVALAIGGGTPALASGACAVAFALPGLIFLQEARRLAARQAALAHVATLAEERGILGPDDLAQALRTRTEDADRILKKAFAEGVLAGAFDARGRFVAASAPRCRMCGAARPRALASGCPSCGATGG